MERKRKRFYREGGMCDFYNNTYAPALAKTLDRQADKWEQAELRRQNG